MSNFKFQNIILLLTMVLSNSLFSQNQVDSLDYYVKENKIKKAFNFVDKYEKNYSINKSNENAEEYIIMLAVLAQTLHEYGINDEVEKLLLQSKDFCKSKLKYNEDLYSNILNVLGIYYFDIHKFDFAENYYLQTLEIRTRLYGNKSIEIANTLNNLAEIYYKQGRYQQAELNFKQSLDIYKFSYPTNNFGYINIYNNYSITLTKLGRYEEALIIAKETINKKIDLLEETDFNFIISLINIAGIYDLTGDLKNAEIFYTKIINITKNNKLFESQNIIASNGLALVYIQTNNLQLAEQILVDNIEKNKTTKGNLSLEYATSLTNLASYYQDIMKFKVAEKLELEALEIRKQKPDLNSIDVLNSYQNLSSLYVSIGNIEKALNFGLKAKKIFEKINGKHHPEYATVLNGLANIYTATKKYYEAEELYKEAEMILDKFFKSNHPNRITTLKNIATVSFYQQKFAQAEFYYNKIIENSDNNFEFFSTEMLAIIEDLYENHTATASHFSKLFPYFQEKVIYLSSFLSFYEMQEQVRNDFFKRFFPLSFLQRHTYQYPEVNIGCYENELLIKNLSLRNQQKITNNIQKSGDTLLQEKFNNFKESKRYLNKLEELPFAQRPANYGEITEKTEVLEKELTRLSSNFAEAKNSISVNWKQIEQKLQPNEIAIDLVSFNYYNKKWTDSIVYSAFVVGKGFKNPKFIPLFEQKQLEFLLSRNKNQIENIKIDNQYADKAISDLFLKPLQEELNGITSIYLSPSGLGHQINFAALPVSETQTLGDKFQVHILGSTAELVNYKVASLDNKNNLELLLYGNIDYDKSDATNKIITDTLSTNNIEFVSLSTRSTNTDKLKYLAGSKIEINKISSLAQQNNFIAAIVDGKNATEESIKTLDSRTKPFVLHLATHGFFFPDTEKKLPKNLSLAELPMRSFYKLADDPMMRSGLMFAGANKFWGKPSENISTDDGILTASEISNLDLSACQLVVMSACDTGLGDINGSEGVFGLQRAFKIAGVKNIIMSLWKIDDEKTVEFFDIFYANCFSGKTIHEAFRVTQTEMKTKYSPFYWAGFVLLE